MKTADFDYELPPDLVAQYPAPDRAASRLLVVSRQTGDCELRTFRDFPTYLRPGDCLVLNDTRVIPARLHGRRSPSGGHVEALVLQERAPGRWECLLRPGRRLRPGDRVELAAPGVGYTVADRLADGHFEIVFDQPDVLDLLERLGQIPLPPYIRRAAGDADRERYQTVYARQPGAVAAPTAGLHFTPETLQRVRTAGVSVETVTLHVGAGTFRPVEVEDVGEHYMHAERYCLPAATADAVNAARRNGHRVVAVGTTTVRVLESCVAAGDPATVCPGSGQTRLFLYPPYRPRVVDALLTNFHLPRSTLLMLVSTFSSVDHVLAAYRLAVRERLRFYSYGDCMLLV